ncbi:MAG TPA: hypothetical protein VGM17_11315, partial [Rhizomicrobium sp.]
MKARIASLAVLATSLVVSMGLGAVADAKPNIAKPMFTVIPKDAPGHNVPLFPPSSSLQTWSGGFTDLTGKAIHFTMVGTDPNSTNTTTTVNVVVIPVIFEYGASNGNMTFDPRKDQLNGMSVLKFMEKSPIFASSVKFKSGSAKLGKSQYIDAFQRANFWSTVQSEPNYHVLLNVTKTLKPLKFSVLPGGGSVITNPWGSLPTGTYPINPFDLAVNTYLTANSADITPDTLPLFISDNVYLTQQTGGRGCCIGGYHSASGTQSYSYTTLVTESGDFSEDISALSHELAEWLDDPFTNNHVNCSDNSILEVGDPLETLSNFGTFTVSAGGFTYHPQDLAFIGYFGHPTPYPSANGWISFYNRKAT